MSSWAPVRERANEILEADGHPPIAHLTRHTLRRTFASILGVCRVDTRRAVALLETLMGCTRDEARAIFESKPIPNEPRKRLPHAAAAR
jgi:hypothetical protein